MLRLSPSLLDSYRYWRSTDFDSPEAESASLGDLLAAIRGDRREPTEAMVRGRAWHAAMESECLDLGSPIVSVTEEGHSFDFRAEDLRTVKHQLPAGAMLELRGTLELPEVGVRMHLRTDGVHGITIHEHKTTGRVDVDRYMASAQWRCYLLAFGCRKVVYHIAKLYKKRPEGTWIMTDYLPVSQYAYPTMRDDILTEAGELADFIEQRGLTEYRRI